MTLREQRIAMLKELIMFDRRLTPAFRCVAFAILDYLLKSNREVAEISHTAIENVVRVKRSTIKKACALLVKFGYLKVRVRRGRANWYSLPGISEVIGTTTEAQAA